MASRPSEAFRIADRRRRIFDGTGAFLHGARWNSPGRRIIYAAGTFAGAMLEILAHTGIGELPHTHAWISIDIPSEVSFEQLMPDDLSGWDLNHSPEARQFGDEWHQQGRSLILAVPSVVTSGIGRNVLINQDHPEFRSLKASRPRDVRWDVRLFPGYSTR
jgi:RES domain-containing protein